MTEERRVQLEEKLNIAEASGDPAQIEAIQKTMAQEYRLCTSHTADRLKRVEKTVNTIKDGLIPAEMFGNLRDGLKSLKDTVVEIKNEMEGWRQRAKGAKMLWSVLRYLAAAGGGGYIMKLLLGGGTGVAP